MRSEIANWKIVIHSAMGIRIQWLYKWWMDDHPPIWVYIIYVHTYVYIYTYIYIEGHHQECIFHMRMRPQKRALAAAPFEHKPTDSQTHSPLPNCEETNCNGKGLGRHVARKQARGAEPHLDKLQGDHATRNYCSSNPHVNKGSRRSHLWLRPSYVRLRPSNPHANKGLRPSHLWLRPSYVPITPLQPACK